MNLFLVLMLREEDDPVRLTEALCDTLTQAKFLHPGEKLSFHTVGNNILIYRSFPVIKGSWDVAEEIHHTRG